MQISLFLTLAFALGANAAESSRMSPKLKELMHDQERQKKQLHATETDIAKIKESIKANEIALSKQTQKLHHSIKEIPQRDADINQARYWQKTYRDQGNDALSRRYAKKAERLERERSDQLAHQQKLTQETATLNKENRKLQEKEQLLKAKDIQEQKDIAATSRVIRFEQQALNRQSPTFFERLRNSYNNLLQRVRRTAIPQEATIAETPPSQSSRFYNWRNYWYSRYARWSNPPKTSYSPLLHFGADYQYNPSRSPLCHPYTEPIPRSRA